MQDVCACVVILKGGKNLDISWKGAKAMMTDTGFLRSLVEFEKDALSEKQVKQVKAYMSNTAFTPDAVAGVSSAGAGLLKWVFAIVNYFAVAKTVNPKRQAVAAGEKALRAAGKGEAEAALRATVAAVAPARLSGRGCGWGSGPHGGGS